MAKRRNGSTHKTTKRYLRISAGPLRFQYIHRIVAAALLGRELTKDEEVHHRDNNKLNCHFSNLVIWGEKDHGWISAKQSWFMKHQDDKLKAEWDKFMDEAEQEQANTILQAKANNEPWQYEDGHLAEKWEELHG